MSSVSVGIALSCNTEPQAWAVVDGDSRSHSEALPAGAAPLEGYLAALAYLDNAPHYRMQRIDLYVQDVAVRRGIVELQDSGLFALLNVQAPLTVNHKFRLVKAASAVADQTSPLTPVVTLSPNGDAPLLFATYASVFASEGPNVSGWAALCDNGFAKYGTVPGRKRIVPELVAMSRMLATVNKATPVTIHSHSRIAVDLVTALQAGRSTAQWDYPRFAPVMRRLEHMVTNTKRSITVIWVEKRGRHPLCGGAERLASHARLGHQYDVDSETNIRVACEIAASATAAYQKRRAYGGVPSAC